MISFYNYKASEDKSQYPTVVNWRFVMGVPIVFAAFILFLLAFQYKLIKNSRQDNRLKNAFWDNEESSLFARKAPIADSDYIHPNSQVLPISTVDEFTAFGRPELYDLQEACFTLSKQPMLDLSHMLNSEVRRKYGASQLLSIETYETTYNSYTQNLFILGQFYYDQRLYNKSILFLEEGLHVGTQISAHILLLGALYRQMNEFEKFNTLCDTVSQMKSITKDKILHRLKSMD